MNSLLKGHEDFIVTHARKEAKLSTHSCKRTGEAQDMIRHLAKTFTMTSIARVFGYTRENIRQICEE